MTTARVIRGTRAKIFLYVCAVLIITGIIACYNNTLTLLDDVKKSHEKCQQQQENLSTQLQVITDLKQRLQNSLKTEEGKHQQIKQSIENKCKEEKEILEKKVEDVKMQYESLQQSFKILETEQNDAKEECNKAKEKQRNEIIEVQNKFKDLQEQLKNASSNREGLKSQLLQMQTEISSLQAKLTEYESEKTGFNSHSSSLLKENQELKKELELLKTKCPGYETLQKPKLSSASPKLEIGKQINIPPSSKTNVDKSSETNLVNPNGEKRVLDRPTGNDVKSSTKSTTKSGLKPSQASLNGARPLGLPSVTSSTPKDKLPDGVVPFPLPEQPVPQVQQEEETQNDNVLNGRYKSKIEEAKAAKQDEVEKENGAQEVFDVQGQDGLSFKGNEAVKHAEKLNFNKQHIDALVADRKSYEQEAGDYKDHNEVQLEENDPEEDDDGEEYADDRRARQKDPAVRN